MIRTSFERRSFWPLCAALLLGVAPVLAAPDDKDAEPAEEEEPAVEWLAIQGGDVYTGTGAVLRGATILSRDGKITEIGYDLYIPEEATVLDATGMRCYPGMVALSASSSISRGLFGGGWVDANTPLINLESIPDDDPHGGIDGHVDLGREEEYVTAADLGYTEADLIGEPKAGAVYDDFDPFSQYLVLSLATGITTAEQSNMAIKLKRGEIEGTVLNEKPLVSVSYSLRNPSSVRRVREDYKKAAEYLRAYRAWEKAKDKDKDAKEPSRKGVDTNALRVLNGEVLARFTANARSELLGIARLAQEFRFRPVIFGCMEGWTVADELGRAGAYAVVTPRTRKPKGEELVRPGGSSIENAAILHRAGVQVAIVPASTGFELSGMTGRDLMHLPIEAGFAIRGGLPEEAALAGITTIPARILGVDHRIGTLEVGKDCDVIVTDGDLLHYETFVQFTVVEGKIDYDKQEELYYAHIRPRPEREYIRKGSAAGDEEASEAEADDGDDAGEKAGDGGENEKEDGEDGDG